MSFKLPSYQVNGKVIAFIEQQYAEDKRGG